MLKIFTFFLLCFSLSAWPTSGPVLKVGDVLLQPLKCWACSLIEAEEETIYSHIGVVIATAPEILVAEAFGTVKQVTLAEFDKKTEPGQKMMVLRFRSEELSQDIQTAAEDFSRIFREDFEGARYDHDFRWNNFDEIGREKFYCSELVAKLFQALMGLEMPIKRMHFVMNRESWTTYFRGNVPDNEWGNSPGDFHRSELFYEVGEL
jgi:uncharacterized protein YycO